MNTCNKVVPAAMACLFFVFKKPRTAQEISELADISIDRVRLYLNAAKEEGLVKCARPPRNGRGESPFYWKRAI